MFKGGDDCHKFDVSINCFIVDCKGFARFLGAVADKILIV